MSGRRSILPILAAGLLVAACNDGSITDPATAVDAQLRAARVAGNGATVMVPIKWTYVMTAASTDVIVCDNSDGSTPFMAFPIEWAVADGMMSHLGVLDTEASSATFSSCLMYIVDGAPVSGDGVATIHLVGANGDAVDLEGVLTLSFADFTATGAWSIIGGTGRFTGASGWINTLEAPTADGSGSQGSGSGMITPPGMLNH